MVGCRSGTRSEDRPSASFAVHQGRAHPLSAPRHALWAFIAELREAHGGHRRFVVHEVLLPASLPSLAAQGGVSAPPERERERGPAWTGRELRGCGERVRWCRHGARPRPGGTRATPRSRPPPGDGQRWHAVVDPLPGAVRSGAGGRRRRPRGRPRAHLSAALLRVPRRGGSRGGAGSLVVRSD